MNKWIGIGNLTRDPELTETPSGVAVCKFTLAVNRNFTNANGDRECDFINVVAWRKLAENCYDFLSKGKKACVVGSLQTRSYNDSNGEKKYVTEIMADEVEFLSPKDEDSHQSQKQPERGGQRGGQQRRKPTLQEFDDDGDIPF